MTEDQKFSELLSLVADTGHPNINALWRISKDLDSMKLNLKFFGYELARKMAEALPIRDVSQPLPYKLQSKASTQEDIESDWVAYWCSKLKIPVVFHRKVWELAYVLQAFHAHGVLVSGARGLGFGCGEEPIPSLLADLDVDVTVTDLSPELSSGLGWKDTGQHTSSIEVAFKDHLTTREKFERHVSLSYVDMNCIPSSLQGFDFCWSICAFEHLGSIENGIKFIEESMKTLRIGGVSVHTTEFNFLNDGETIDNWNTVLFQRRHFVEMKNRLESSGHTVMPLNFDVGSKPLDKFIDLPPFSHDWQHEMAVPWAHDNNHIKVQVDGFPSTCFGLVVLKGH